MLKRALVRVGVAAVALVGAAIGGLEWLGDMAGPDHGLAERTEWVVLHGATAADVARRLAREERVRSAYSYRWEVQARDWQPRAGRHVLVRGMSARQVARALAGEPLGSTAPLVVVEGARARDVDNLLARAGLAGEGDYLRRVNAPAGFTATFPLPGASLEGYLAPSTYELPVRGPADLDALVRAQLAMFARRFVAPHASELARGNTSLHEVVTLASLVEREEPRSANRPLVAGVMVTRLQRGIPLGVDATSRYRLEDWGDRRGLLAALADAEDPYNTRLRTGLPPTPIASPGVDAFRAALHPLPTGNLYYLHDADGRLHMARSAREHDENRRRFNVH